MMLPLLLALSTATNPVDVDVREFITRPVPLPFTSRVAPQARSREAAPAPQLNSNGYAEEISNLGLASRLRAYGAALEVNGSRSSRDESSNVDGDGDVALDRALHLLGPFTTEEVTELHAALASLPPGLRRFPGGPLTLELHPEPSAFGMGDGTSAHPDRSEDHARFHLYALAPSREAIVSGRLPKLTPTQERALWRRRALVHAVLQRWDDALGLSKTRRFKRVTAWLDAFERPLTWRQTPLNTFPGAYSRRRGMESAQLDLLTFAEELFVPPSAVGAPALAPDEDVRCRELSKTRFLREALGERELIAPSALQPSACPGFDAWADLRTLSHVEALFVAASGRAPESLFGHLALQLVRKPGAHVEGPSFGSVIQLVALTGEQEGGFTYALRGIGGGFSAGVVTTAMAGVAHQSLEREQRTMRRYRLELSPVELTRFAEKTWELERRGYFDYFFFTDNCATLLVLLLNSALEEGRQVRLPSRFGPTLPGAVLDAIHEVRGADGPPLLTYLPDALECTRDAAERAERQRAVRLEALSAALAPADSARLRQLHAATLSPDRRVRAAGYAQLSALAEHVHRGADATQLSWLYDYLAQTVRVERYAYDRALQALFQHVKRSQALAREQAPQDLRLAQRQAQFRDEAALAAGRLVLDQAQETEEVLAEQPLTPEQAALRDEALAQRALFERLTQQHGELVDRYFASVDAQAWHQEDHARKVSAEQRAAANALARSGFARTWIAAGGSYGQGLRPTAVLHSAVLSEELGEARLHGFQASSELRVLDGELAIRPTGSWPELFRSELTLVAYRTLRRELPAQRRSALDQLGWGFWAGWDFDADRPHTHSAAVRAEALAVPVQSDDFGSYLALGLGGFASARWGSSALTPVAGPRASAALRTHLFGNTANALRVEASWEPGLDSRASWVHSLRAEARLELLVGSLDRWALRLGPQAVAQLELSPRDASTYASARVLWFVELL